MLQTLLRLPSFREHRVHLSDHPLHALRQLLHVLVGRWVGLRVPQVRLDARYIILSGQAATMISGRRSRKSGVGRRPSRMQPESASLRHRGSRSGTAAETRPAGFGREADINAGGESSYPAGITVQACETVQAKVLPPFTEKLCPVMKPAPSLARKATNLATSSGLPIRFMGTPAV